MARFKISSEDSEVDKVYDEEHSSNDSSNSNELSAKVKALIDENKEKEENPEEEQAADDVQVIDSEDDPSPDGDPEEVTDEEDSESDEQADTDDSDDTAGDEADEEDSGDELNAASEMIMESYQIILAAKSMTESPEVRISKEGFAEIGTSLKETSLQAAAYLKDAGIEYGPKLFKLLGKTIVFALGMTLKGLHKSSKALANAINDSRNSYLKLGQRLKNIEASLALLKEQSIDKTQSGAFYSKESVIHDVTTGSQFKPQATLVSYKTFLKNYIGKNTDRAEKTYYGLRQLFGRVSLSEVSDIVSLMQENAASQGLVAGNIPGYKAINDDVEVYHYPQSLPGNLFFMAYLPKKDLQTPEEVYNAYHTSRYFVGVNLNQVKGFGKVPYLSVSEIDAMLKELGSIHKWGEDYLGNLKVLTSYKKLIEYNLKAMAQKLAARITASKQEVQAIEFINLKIYFFQKCFIRDMVDIERTNRRILLSYVRYMEASVLELAQTSKD